MKNWINFKSVIGALIIAVIGSALWENIFRGLFSFFGKGLLIVSTLGIQKYKDNIYTDIARGFYEGVSLQILYLFLGILLAIVISLVLATFRKLNDSEDEKHQSKIIDWLFSTKRRAKWFLLIYTFFLVSVCLLSLSRATYTNKSIAYYNQLLKIATPYLTEDQEKGYDSKFAQIKNRYDFIQITKDLEMIVVNHNQKLPDPPSFIF